jgi:hypothetical protein
MCEACSEYDNERKAEYDILYKNHSGPVTSASPSSLKLRRTKCLA